MGSGSGELAEWLPLPGVPFSSVVRAVCFLIRSQLKGPLLCQAFPRHLNRISIPAPWIPTEPALGPDSEASLWCTSGCMRWGTHGPRGCAHLKNNHILPPGPHSGSENSGIPSEPSEPTSRHGDLFPWSVCPPKANLCTCASTLRPERWPQGAVWCVRWGRRWTELFMCPHTVWEAPQDGVREKGAWAGTSICTCAGPRTYQGCSWLSIISLYFICS